MVTTDPVRTKGVRCGWCARCSSRPSAGRILRGEPTTARSRTRSGTCTARRNCLGTLERSQWTSLRLSLTLPCNDATGVVQ